MKSAVDWIADCERHAGCETRDIVRVDAQFKPLMPPRIHIDAALSGGVKYHACALDRKT